MGVALPRGGEVEGCSQHFLSRVIGQHAADDIGRPGMRRGVNIEDIRDALEHPIEVQESVKKIQDGKVLRSYVVTGDLCKVSVDPDTGYLIQVQPNR